jgi:hypothetical protein
MTSQAIEQKRVAVAAVMMICVWIVHVYAAIWVRGMTRGYVSGWGRRHRRKQLPEMLGRIITPERAVRRTAQPGSLHTTWPARFVNDAGRLIQARSYSDRGDCEAADWAPLNPFMLGY